MIKVFVDLLMFMRQVFFKLSSSLFEQLRDEKTGNIKNIKPTNLKFIFMWLSLFVFVGLVAVKIHQQ